MKSPRHPFDAAVAELLAMVEGTAKDRLLRKLSGLSRHKASGDETFDALAIEQIVPVSADHDVAVRVKIGGQGNLVASDARFGEVSHVGDGVFSYSPLPGYAGPDQFAVKDGLGNVTLVRITVR